MSGTDLQVPEHMNLDAAPPVQPEPVPAPAPEAAEQRPPSEREQVMARIAARFEEQRSAELAQGVVQHDEAVARGEALADEPEEPAPPAPQPPAPEPIAAAPPAPAAPTVRAVTMPDGNVIHVTDEQFGQLAQMGVLANLALSQPVQPPPVAPQPAPAPRPLVDEQRAREFIRQLQYGGEDAALPAVTALIEDIAGRMQPAPQQINPDHIITIATQRALAAHQAQQDAAAIRTEFPDIFANEQLRALAHINVDAIARADQATGRVRPLIDIYREAGTRVLDALGQSRPGSDQPAALQAAPAVQPRADVFERKRAAPRIPAAIDRRAATPDAARPPTNSEIVARMRVARHQPPLN